MDWSRTHQELQLIVYFKKATCRRWAFVFHSLVPIAGSMHACSMKDLIFRFGTFFSVDGCCYVKKLPAQDMWKLILQSNKRNILNYRIFIKYWNWCFCLQFLDPLLAINHILQLFNGNNFQEKFLVQYLVLASEKRLGRGRMGEIWIRI